MKLKLRRLVFFFFIFIIFDSHAAMTGFCFDRSISLAAVKSYLSPILKPGEKVYPRASMNCIELDLSSARKGLFEKWINRRYRIEKLYSGNQVQDFTVENNERLRHCRAQLRRVLKGKGSRDNIDIKKGGTAKRTEYRTEGTRSSNLLLGVGRKGHIEVNGNRVGLICFPRGVGRYEIDVSVIESNGNSLSTSIQVSSGSSVNIGEVVENIKRKGRNIDIRQGVGFNRTKEENRYDYFLVVQ
jgi:hypothetical protein